MFTNPINEITFEDVQVFCRECPESVIVEYKREINVKKQIPKIVSSFANTFGGTFIIGVECDKIKNEVISIDGIPPTNGIEEQILQSSLMGIYPPVNPVVKIVDMPDSDNVVVVVQVDESVRAPHAITKNTKVYIRKGNITQPYELADIDHIEHMFKRREDSQIVSKQILDRMEERAGFLIRPGTISPRDPALTISVQPIFPYRPIISPSIIYNLHYPQNFPPRRIDGGVCYFRDNERFEFNEYGIVYRRILLNHSDNKEIMFGRLLYEINYYLDDTRNIYQHCEYLGDIEFKLQLHNATGYKMEDLMYRGVRIVANIMQNDSKCSDSDIVAVKRCLSRDLESRGKRGDIIEELIGKILWSFDIPIDAERVGELVRKRIDESIR